MKSTFRIIILILFLTNKLFAQQKKSSIVILPSYDWCVSNGFTRNVTINGVTNINSDYQAAFSESKDLRAVVNVINSLMSDKGFRVINNESVINLLQKTPLDKSKKVSETDLIIEVSWVTAQRGPFKSISYTLKGVDPNTDKEVASLAVAATKNVSTPINLLIYDAVYADIENFSTTLRTYFNSTPPKN